MEPTYKTIEACRQLLAIYVVLLVYYQPPHCLSPEHFTLDENSASHLKQHEAIHIFVLVMWELGMVAEDEVCTVNYMLKICVNFNCSTDM